MRTILFISYILLLSSCSIKKPDSENVDFEKHNNKDTIENFEAFFEKFYSDTSFQKERIITPLKGEKKYWHETEDIIITVNWEVEEIPKITSYQKIHESINKVTQEFIKEELRITEKIYIQNSGFYMNRTFEIRKNKWYLLEYHISDI